MEVAANLIIRSKDAIGQHRARKQEEKVSRFNSEIRGAESLLISKNSKSDPTR